MPIRKKSIVTGAFILAAANILTRLLGFVYRIYMSNAIGAEGMGLYQLVLPLYSLAWSIACSGFTTTVSKLVAQENAKREYGNMGRVLKQSLFITCAISAILTVLMYSFAGTIGETFFNDTRVVMPIRILALAIPVMAAGSCIRGYFLGLQETVVPAVSQVLEQCVRMIVIYSLAGLFIPRGLEYACAAAVLGIFCGELVSFLYILYSYRSFKTKHKLKNKPNLSPVQCLTLIFSMALPLTGNRISGSLLATLENVLIPQRLIMYGMTQKEAISAFGRITGMVMPLVMFPSALLHALSVSLVPAISEATAVSDNERITNTVSKSFLFTSIVGIGACAVFLTVPDELGKIIYNQDIGRILFIFGTMCPFLYLNITMSGILNGLGHQVFIFRTSLITSCINLFCIYFFVPKFGVTAFIAGWFAGMLYSVFTSLRKIGNGANINIKAGDWFVKPVLSAAAATLTVRFISRTLIFPAVGGIIGLLASLFMILLFYMGFIIILKCITADDLRSLYKKSRALPIS